jgi:hypothetical protein
MFVIVDLTVIVQSVRVYVLSTYQVSHCGIIDSLVITKTETQRTFLHGGCPVVLLNSIKILP